MSAESKQHNIGRYYSFGNNYFSNDTLHPTLIKRSFYSEKNEREHCLRERPHPPQTRDLIHEAVMPDEFLSDPTFERTIPSGGYSLDYRFGVSGELSEFTMKMYPEITGMQTRGIIERSLGQLDNEARESTLKKSYRDLYWGFSDKVGLWLVVGQEAAFHMRNDITWEAGDGYQQNYGSEWEGEKRYKFETDGSATFECVIGKVTYTDPIVDTFKDDIIYYDFPHEHYVVAGALLASENVNELIARTIPMIKNKVITQDRMREIIMPYLYVTPVNYRAASAAETVQEDEFEIE